jgi:hypothetical protein
MSVTTVPTFNTKLTPAGMSNAQLIDSWAVHFAGAQSNWTRPNYAAGSAFTLEDPGNTCQINVRVDGGVIKFLYEPSTGITDAETLAGISGNQSDEHTFVQATSLASTFLVIEWADYIRILQRTDATTPPSYVEMAEAGKGVYGLGGSDDGNGLDGACIFVGEPSIDSSTGNAILTSSFTTKSQVRTATGIWQDVKARDATIPESLTAADHMDVGGRTEPAFLFVRLHISGASQRTIAVHKYWFGYTAASRFSGDKFDDDTNSRQMVVVGNNTTASFRWMTPVIDGFDPTA